MKNINKPIINKANKPLINKEALTGISEYCTNREWKCNNCRYSIKKVVDNPSKSATCIFANCPCDWKIN